MKNVYESLNWRELKELGLKKLQNLHLTDKCRFMNLMKKMQKAQLEEEDLRIIGSPSLIKYLLSCQFYEKNLFNNFIYEMQKQKKIKKALAKSEQEKSQYRAKLEYNYKKIKSKKSEMKFVKQVLGATK
jgi:hypothetical protein